ncbi:MAG: glycosyltransferase [Akkermansia sp.]|nr:glycosyltransferase [Akkermansia sp.]
MVTATPLISVIVPVYNSGAYLRVCLDSLVAQDAESIEFVCIDDGSTDGSPAELDAQAAADSRFRVIHQENGGYGKAMNVGLAAARGAYIGIVEPDDWVEPDMFSTLQRLLEGANADIAKVGYTEESEKKTKIECKYAPYAEGTVLPPVELPEVLERGISIWCGLYRRDLLERHAIRFSETPRASFQDLGFGMRTWAYARSIVVSPRTMYHYRVDNPNSSERRKEEGAWAIMRELELQQDLFDAIPSEDRLRRSLLLRRAFHSFLYNYRWRLFDTLRKFLPKFAILLRKLCPFSDLLPEAFSNNEWHDLQLLYSYPLMYPAKRRCGVTFLQKLFFIRREGGKVVLRFRRKRLALRRN